MNERKADFIRQYQMTGGTAEDGERMWSIKCRDKAAPDLLAACKLAQKIFKAIHDQADGDAEMTAASDAVDIAIAKAEGQ